MTGESRDECAADDRLPDEVPVLEGRVPGAEKAGVGQEKVCTGQSGGGGGVREWLALCVAAGAVALSVYNLIRTEIDRDRTIRIEVDAILLQAWDAIGGKPYSRGMDEYSTDDQDLERATRLIEKAEALLPGYVRTKEYRAELLVAERKFDEAIDIMRDLIRSSHEDDAYLHVRLAYTLLGSRRYAEAVRVATESIRLGGEKDGWCFLARGRCLASFGKHEDALKDYSRAGELGWDRNVWYHKFVGISLAALRRSDTEALRHLDEAIRLGLDHAEIHHARAELLARLGRLKEAAAARRRAEQSKRG